MLTADRILTDAKQIAKVRGFDGQALDQINAILSDLCQTTDLALARGQFEFNFNPSLTSLFGSGPYPLPLDYLRTSGSSGARGVTRSAWYLYPYQGGAFGPNPFTLDGSLLDGPDVLTPIGASSALGTPIFMTPIDLAEFDLFPKMNSQSTPALWATDMGGPLTQRIILATPMATTLNSVTATPALLTGLVAGLGVAGEGIEPGTTIVSVGATTIVLSIAATATLAAASVFFGIAPVAYVYPAPLGTYPVTVRYQRMMPPLIALGQYPWFPMDGYLIDKLAAKMMAFSDDARELTRDAKAEAALGRYLGLSDDKSNRSQAVQLDSRNYGHGGAGGRGLKSTKHAGW